MEFTLSQVSLPCDVEVEATGPLFSPTLLFLPETLQFESLIASDCVWGYHSLREREREGDVQEVTLPNLGLGLAHDAGKWLLGQMSDIGCCLFICLQQGDPVKHWPTTAAP